MERNEWIEELFGRLKLLVNELYLEGKRGSNPKMI